jgi:hypothetical protein
LKLISVEPLTEAITPEQAEDEDHSVDLDTRLAMLMQELILLKIQN